MTKSLKSLPMGFTQEIRAAWAVGQIFQEEPTGCCWPRRQAYTVNLEDSKSYKMYAADGILRPHVPHAAERHRTSQTERAEINWNDGDFILQLEKFNNYLYNQNSYQFAVIGCQGVDTSWRTNSRRPIQEHIGRMVSNPQLSPKQTHIGSLKLGPVTPRCDFKLFTGDNAYDFGVTEPMSPYFKQAFGKYYNGSPNFVITGNHDWNFHGSAKYTPYNLTHSHLYRAMCQVYHSYIKQDISYSWHMPYLYYAIRSELANFICIDSNTFVFDEVQQNWFNRVYRTLSEDVNSKGGRKWLILVSHHPLEYYGPRRTKIKPEWKKYRQRRSEKTYSATPKLNSYRRERAQPALDLNITKTIGALLQRFLEYNDYKFDVVFCAHEHAMITSTVELTYTNGVKGSILQVISGGGGAKLNKVTMPDDTTSKIHFLRKEYGFANVFLNEQELTIRHHYLHKQPSSHCMPCSSKREFDPDELRGHTVTIDKDSRDKTPNAAIVVRDAAAPAPRNAWEI